MSSIAKFVHFHHFVGALGALVELGALALALDVVGVPLHATLVIASSAAVAFNCPLHRGVTFELGSGTVVFDDVGVEPA